MNCPICEKPLQQDFNDTALYCRGEDHNYDDYGFEFSVTFFTDRLMLDIYPASSRCHLWSHNNRRNFKLIQDIPYKQVKGKELQSRSLLMRYQNLLAFL